MKVKTISSARYGALVFGLVAIIAMAPAPTCWGIIAIAVIALAVVSL